MKKFFFLMLLAVIFSQMDASAEPFSAGQTFYHGAEVNMPTIIRLPKNYNINGNMVVSHSLSDISSGTIHISGNLVVNAPLNLQGTGNVMVGGNLIVKDSIQLLGSSNIIVGGQVIMQGTGTVNITGIGRVMAVSHTPAATPAGSTPLQARTSPSPIPPIPSAATTPPVGVAPTTATPTGSSVTIDGATINSNGTNSSVTYDGVTVSH